MDVRLPNGKLIRGVPDGTPKEAVMAKAIQAGLAAAEDFGQQPTQEEPEQQQAPTSPRMKRAQERSAETQERQAAFEESIKSNIPLFQGDVGQLEEIGAAPELNEFSTRALKSSLAANLIGSDFELAEALKAQIPEATFSRDEDLNLIATMPSGGSFYLNAPGFSGQDVAKVATRMLGFTPAGRGITGISGQALKQLAGRSALTETGLQATEESLGGEFNPEDVAIAGVAAPAGQVVGSKIASSLQSRSAEKALQAAAPTVDALKDSARAVYQKIDDLGVRIPAIDAQKLSSQSIAMLKKSGYNAKIQPKISGVIDELESFAKTGGTVGELDTLRKVAANAAKSNEASEAALASKVIDRIDDFMDDFVPSGQQSSEVSGLYKEARSLWSKAKKAEMIDLAFERAKNQASGFENGIRVQFRSLLNNPKKMRGFSKEEKSAIADIVRGTNTTNTLKALGKFGFTEGQATNMMLATLGIAGGGVVAGPGGAAAVPIIGQTARTAAQKLTERNAKTAAAMIKAGKDGRQIALQYIKTVPKNERSMDELTGLLLGKDVDLSGVGKIADPFIKDSAIAASLILQSKPEIEKSIEDKGK